LDSVGTNHILQQYFNSSQDTQVLQHKPLGPFRNLRGVNHIKKMLKLMGNSVM